LLKKLRTDAMEAFCKYSKVVYFALNSSSHFIPGQSNLSNSAKSVLLE